MWILLDPKIVCVIASILISLLCVCVLVLFHWKEMIASLNFYEPLRSSIDVHFCTDHLQNLITLLS